VLVAQRRRRLAARLREQPLQSLVEVDLRFPPLVPAGDEEAGVILLGVEELEHADADAAGQAEDHRFSEGLPGPRIDDAAMGQDNAQRRGGGHTAGPMTGEQRISRWRGRRFDDLEPGGGVALAGLLHALADELLEMLLGGHGSFVLPAAMPEAHACRLAALGKPRTTMKKGLEDRDPLCLREAARVGRGGEVGRERPPMAEV